MDKTNTALGIPYAWHQATVSPDDWRHSGTDGWECEWHNFPLEGTAWAGKDVLTRVFTSFDANRDNILQIEEINALGQSNVLYGGGWGVGVLFSKFAAYHMKPAQAARIFGRLDTWLQKSSMSSINSCSPKVLGAVARQNPRKFAALLASQRNEEEAVFFFENLPKPDQTRVLAALKKQAPGKAADIKNLMYFRGGNDQWVKDGDIPPPPTDPDSPWASEIQDHSP